MRHDATHTTQELMDFFTCTGFILDLGTNWGRHAAYLREKGFDIVGLDISSKDLKASRIKKLVCANAMKLPFKDKVFDSVLCFELLEHLFKPKDCLKEIRRILKQGGYACITTPCYNLPLGRVAVPLYRKLAGVDLRPGEHIQVFNSARLLKTIRSYFLIEEVYYTDFTVLLKWRFSCGYSLDNFLSNLCKQSPLLKYFAGSVFIKARVGEN